MEMDKTSLLEKDANLARFRDRYNKLILVFKFFFFFLALIIATLFIYLVRDIDSESDRSIPDLNPVNETLDPIIRSESQIFLQTAVKELEDVTSSILYNYLGTNTDTNTEFALNSCWKSLQNGSTRIQDALEANPFPGIGVIVEVEESIKSCLDDLEKVESTAAMEVRAKVHRVKVYLSSWGEYLMSFEYIWQKLLDVIGGGWKMILENMFLVCLCVLQLLFIFYLLWTVLKFR